MSQVSVGQVENLEDLVRDLQSVQEALGGACREQIFAAEEKYTEVCDEVKVSESMLESAKEQEHAAYESLEVARQHLAFCQEALQAAYAALAACSAYPPAMAAAEAAVISAEAAVVTAEAAVIAAEAAHALSVVNRQAMEGRVALVQLAKVEAQKLLLETQQECNVRLFSVQQSVMIGTARLNAAQQELSAYLATNPPAAEFHSWLKWNPAQNGRPVTPDTLRDRMNLSSEQRRLFQEYLYDRNPAYRKQVDKYRNQWATAKGDAERNIVARRARIHLSGEFGEQIARHALAPLGGRIETQGRTFVGDNGRYTKTDLLVTDLRVPVILGRGEGMGAPVGGSMAFEVKCGKAEYLYSQKDHMVFQAEGHKQADAQCTLCSRDIHDLPPEKEKELRDTLRDAGSPMVGMLPSKNEIDQSCLDFVRQDEEV
ncbi:hypothetical protein [Pseudomonas aeruginosa]|uniref:hypothetical protein n=1 Tax=Pseudomonas aeruginosa TaxID=287 RepID=UPI0021C9EBE0|nr:hypothetical protein [Pseudomonas aeruginosa]